MEYILDKLKSLSDKKYGDFQASLVPGVDGIKVIGVRTPVLRSMAKELKGTEAVKTFMDELPHEYFEEDQLHAFLISEIKDYDKCMSEIEKFLPYVNNWATCDQMNPKVIGKEIERLNSKILEWLQSSHTYTVRFALKCYMNFFLDDKYFDTNQLELAVKASRESEEYYIKMMVAWYFATALYKQYDATVKFIEQHKLDDWTHRKAIQKARESYRITDEQKEYLKTLK